MIMNENLEEYDFDYSYYEKNAYHQEQNYKQWLKEQEEVILDPIPAEENQDNDMIYAHSMQAMEDQSPF